MSRNEHKNTNVGFINKILRNFANQYFSGKRMMLIIRNNLNHDGMKMNFYRLFLIFLAIFTNLFNVLSGGKYNSAAAQCPVTLTGKTNICQGQSDTLTASGGQTYRWNTGATSSFIVVQPATNTTYSVLGFSGNCKDSNSIVVAVSPLPTVTATNDTNLCLGDTIALSATGATTYTWAPSTGLSCNNCPSTDAFPTATITYTVIGTDAEGCTNATNVTVVVETKPSVSVAGSNSVCEGSTVPLTANATGSGVLTYSWQPGNYIVSEISVSPSITTIYTVVVSNLCGSATANFVLNVSPVPIVNFTSYDTGGCVPSCTQFFDLSTVSQGRIIAWNWDFGDGDSSTTRDPLHCYKKSGFFTVGVSITSDSGCSSFSSKTNMVSIYNHPYASFTISPFPVTEVDPNVQFVDQSTDEYGSIQTWQWNFGNPYNDSVASYIQFPQYLYPDSGTFCPSLVVTNVHGCTDTTKQCFTIQDLYSIYIPNAFTPNGLGFNEIFSAKGKDIKSFEMYIYDKWGMQLYHTTNINNGWNGTVNNDSHLCPIDSYVYYITTYDGAGKIHKYLGMLDLLR